MPNSPQSLLIAKLQSHTSLRREDISAIARLPLHTRHIRPNEDIVKQGDKPTTSALVTQGTVARYHALRNGKRQYLSFHSVGDMPESQSLFLDVMDHAVCAIDDVTIALIPHSAIHKLLDKQPGVGAAIWREMLIDAAIFRETITNNSSRDLQTRLAHFLGEQYYRARAAGRAKPGSCRLPLSQLQLADTIGASHISVNRAMQKLRQTGAVDLAGGNLLVHDWPKLRMLGDFNPTYLHLKTTVRT